MAPPLRVACRPGGPATIKLPLPKVLYNEAVCQKDEF